MLFGNLRKWSRSSAGRTDEVESAPTVSFEFLESRLLLDADLNSSVSLFSLDTTLQDSAILVDGNGVLANNDPGENPFSVEVPAGVTTSEPPEIMVTGNGYSIADGDTTPGTTDWTDFGSVAQGASPLTRAYRVRNDGTGELILGTLTVPAGFTILDGLAASVAPGSSDVFTIQLDTTTAGTKSGQISFSTNDGDENPFNFTIYGVVMATGPPEIRVTGNGYSIADGDTTPGTLDWTDFGSLAQDGTPVSRPYRVLNDGTGPLTPGLLSVPEGFSVVVDLSSPVAPGSSVVFRVQLDTTVAGTKSGDISFTNNDSNENPFNFRISGTVTPGTTAPEVIVLGNSIEIPDGDTSPSAADGTDFGAVVQGAAAVSRTFTVRNEGTALLTLRVHGHRGSGDQLGGGGLGHVHGAVGDRHGRDQEWPDRHERCG
ncbi:MAG: choice-of-anchor D domain-containing protein [Planctomycetes bacterium]|nr:choice-of-anchor D domain-containing protein [Planctomycetota bacterium]